jgi:hypothetical protein
VRGEHHLGVILEKLRHRQTSEPRLIAMTLSTTIL